jgi:hypothetical protein
MKKILDVDPNDLSEDWKLNLFNEVATSALEEILNRQFTYATRTVVYQGTGTLKLLLNHRPVYPNPPAPYSAINVIIDEGAFYGSTPGAFTNDGTTQSPLVYGTDYCLQFLPNDPPGGSRSGILVRIGAYWPKPQVRQAGYLSPFLSQDTGSVQVTYTAGFTVDTLPVQLRMAANMLIARLLYLFPLGMELGSDSYEERSIGLSGEAKNYLISPSIWAMIGSHVNRKF